MICTMDDVREDFLGPPHGTTPYKAYKGLVRPVLEYGSSVWDSDTHGLHEELDMEKVLNRAARFVTGNDVFETGRMSGIVGQTMRDWNRIRIE